MDKDSCKELFMHKKCYGEISKTFKNIVNGYQTIEPTIPESFLVLQKELFALGISLLI